MNSLEKELSELTAEIKSKEIPAQDLNDLEFYDGFNVDSVRRDLRSATIELDSLKSELKESKRKTVGSSAALIGASDIYALLPGHWKLLALVPPIAWAVVKAKESFNHIEKLDRLSADISSKNKQISNIENSLVRYESIDIHKLRALVKSSKCYIDIANAKVSYILKTLERLRENLKLTLETRAAVEIKHSRATKNLLKAIEFDNRLKATAEADRRGRRAIHKECGALFKGVESPIDLINQFNREIAGCARKIEKIDNEVEIEIKKLTIEIKRAFLDGNNLFNHGRMFIGLRPVQALASALHAKGIEVTVCFDHLIGPPGSRISHEHARSAFEEGIEVVIGESGREADRSILRMARTKTDCVISNDGYIEFADLAAKLNDRVFKARFYDRSLEVEELDIHVEL